MDKRILVMSLTDLLVTTLLLTLFAAHAIAEEDILVTGFKPWGNIPSNISEQIIDELQNVRGVETMGNLKVRYLVMNVTWGEPETDIGQMIDEIQNEGGEVFAILSLGETGAGTRDEMQAINTRLGGPDAENTTYTDQNETTIIASDDINNTVQASSAMVEAIQAGLEAEAVNFSMSDDAGTFVCNEALYADMRIFVEGGKAQMAGFLHIYEDEDVNTMTDAVEKILLQIAAINSGVDSWSMFHHDSNHTGCSTSTVPGPETNQTLWTCQTGGFVWSSPAVSNNVVYVGSGDGRVYAIDAVTGNQVWNCTIEPGAGSSSSPAVADGIVYVCSYSGDIYALNATTGATVWKYEDIPGSMEGTWETSPAVADGVVYVGSDDFNVYALNATTGTLIWNYTTGGWVFSSPAVANGVVYVGSADDNVYALNATTGTPMWNYTTGSCVSSSPAVANGVVYVGSADYGGPTGYNIYALNATTGTLIWNYTTGNYVNSSPAVAGGLVYVGSHDDNVYALNATTGTLVWSYKTGDLVISSPAVVDGVVYVGSDDFNVYALNATTGTLIWSYTTGNFVCSSPAVVDGVVYVGSHDGLVYAFGIPFHDIAINDVTSSKTVVGQGYDMNVTVTAADLGDYPETFNVSVYANTTIIASQNVTLSSGNSANVDFTWNTTGLAYGNYTVSAYAWPVPGETNTANNNCTGGSVYVGIPGDVEGIGKVDMGDVMTILLAFGSTPGKPNWNPNCDIEGTGRIEMADVIIALLHFGQQLP